MKQVLTASRTLLAQKVYLLLFLGAIPILFFIFVFIPVKTIPGNDFAFQLSIFTIRDWFLMFLLSAATSLLIAMNIYIFRERRALIQAGQTGIGGFSSVVGAVFGTAACSACIAALFGFLGLPAVIFLIKARLYIVAGAIALILVSLYFASKKVVQACEKCNKP